MNTLAALALGVAGGLIANAAYYYATDKLAAFFGRIRITGYWGEYVAEPAERQYSLGEIRYDFRRRMWVFDGTNFHNGGTPFCDWSTTASSLDRDARVLHYIFENTIHGEGQVSYAGFGQVSLARHGREREPSTGFFVSGTHGELYRAHSMVQVENLPRSREERLKLFETIASESGLEND